jgi:general stress protein 26
MNPILLFSIATVVNVTLSTVRAICTIKGGKMLSAITNAVCYGFYPLIVMLTAQGTVEIIVNMAITALANFVCVYIIKLVEEKARKDKLWKVEATIHSQGIEPQYDDCIIALKNSGVPFNYIDANKYIIINCYCATQKESLRVKEILNEYNAKYFVSESKTL